MKSKNNSVCFTRYEIGNIVWFKNGFGDVIKGEIISFKITDSTNLEYIVHGFDDNTYTLNEWDITGNDSDHSLSGNESSDRFKKVTENLLEVYIKKNADYGDSFSKTIEKYGPIAALTRMSDKFNRIENLILNGKCEVKDESLADSLLDLANYCIMTYLELHKSNKTES